MGKLADIVKGGGLIPYQQDQAANAYKKLAQSVPATAPMPDDQAILADKKRKAAALAQGSGRLSTILSDYGTNDKLGG